MPHSFVDLSHTVEHGMVTYDGLPAPLICDFLTREASRKIYADGTEEGREQVLRWAHQDREERRAKRAAKKGGPEQ